jgi:hypothetical protein
MNRVLLASVCVSVCVAMGAGGCLPDDMPAYVNGDKTIVAVAGGVLWTYDIPTKTATSYPAPKGWGFPFAMKIGDDVWVHWQHDLAGGEEEYACARFDPAKKDFASISRVPFNLFSSNAVIPVSYEGKKCLFVNRHDDDIYDVVSFPGLVQQKSVQMEGLMSAGNFWWLRGVPAGSDEPSEGIDVFNAEGKQVCTISPEEAGKANTGESPQYARVSADGKVLLLAYHGGASFAVFDTATGKCLWGQSKFEPRHVGTPLVTANEVWTFELPEPDPKAGGSATAPASAPTSKRVGATATHIALIRYTRSTGDDSTKAIREVVLTYPLDPRATGQFAPSPDGTHLVLQTKEEDPPRLLIFPLRAGATAKDVEVVELKAKE